MAAKHKCPERLDLFERPLNRVMATVKVVLVELDEKATNQVYLPLFLSLIHWCEVWQLPERLTVNFEREGRLKMTADVCQ